MNDHADSKQAGYLAYMVRLWRESGSTAWRATLDNPHTGERHGFANVQALFEFLEQQMHFCAGNSDEEE